MEFRFFFPVVHSSDDWISLPIKEEYENKLNIMKHYFLEKVNCPTSEKRVDSYYVGGPLVGVKLRVLDVAILLKINVFRLGRKWKLN